jgi:putative membrane protein
MKKIFVCGLLMSSAIFGLSGCGGERTSNVNTTNMNRDYLSTNGNANSFSATADPNNNKSESNANMVNSTPAMNSQTGTMNDPDFVTEAAVGGMAEVELGRLAANKAQNPEVKKFAQQMIADHTKSNNELKTLAGGKNMTLPTELDAKHKSTMTELQGLSGAAFDKAYIAGQLADHERTVKLFQGQSQSGTDAEIKAFAAKNLPALQMHLEMVRNLNNKMISGGGDGTRTNTSGGNMSNMR